ncbi:MAG: AraC family transcriptional regulator [Variovorax sp.]|nr:MAG: AraC family transcriptional regulator [Variovorax sp.]
MPVVKTAPIPKKPRKTHGRPTQCGFFKFSMSPPPPGARGGLLEDSDRRAGVSDRVREYIVILLPRGHCRADVVAQHMGVDRRTVSRHLSTEGNTFSALVDGVRRELLERYLKEGARPLGEVSALLGFSAASVFSRWHRSQFGVAARSRICPKTSRWPGQ